MPKGIYKHRPNTKEQNNKIRRANLGKKHSDETRKKLSSSHLGKNYSKMNENKLGINHHRWKGGNGNDKAYYNRRYRMRKNGNQGYHTRAEWETLKAQYNWTCIFCKKSEPEIKLTEDHIIPVSKFGSDNIENIQPLCRKCNSRKGTKIINNLTDKK